MKACEALGILEASPVENFGRRVPEESGTHDLLGSGVDGSSSSSHEERKGHRRKIHQPSPSGRA
eukprot:898979-Heterocapsa_arctica.AAC.1